MSELIELMKRHGSSHFANVKIGHFLFFLTLCNVFGIYLFHKVYLTKWSKSGRSTTFKRLVSTPNYIKFILWVVVILGLCFYKFKPAEFSVFIKRLGRFAYILLPLDIFLAFKPNPLPNIYYLELVFLHKWISRLIVLMSFSHGLLFIIKWSKEHTLFKIFTSLNFLGVVQILGFLTIVTISLKPIRHRFYKVFFTTHLILAWISPFVLQFHARPGVTLYSFIIVVLFIAQIITKIWKSKNSRLEIKTSPGSSLQVIKFPNDFGSFLPASHIRLSNYSKQNILTYLLVTHPFTISSLPNESSIKLVVKKTSLTLSPNINYAISNPYPSLHSNFFKTAENVLLIAGGSGISYTLGLYQNLISNNSTNVTMIWVLKNKSDLWILDHFNVRKIDIYITSETQKTDDDYGAEDEQLLESLQDDEFELEDIDPFDDINEVTNTSLKTIKFGRPNLNIYAGCVNQFDKANNWVISCGTKSLNDDCSKWASSLKARFHSEIYEL